MNAKRDAGAVERRVGRRTRKEWLLIFAVRSWLLTIRRKTRSIANAPYGPTIPCHMKAMK